MVTRRNKAMEPQSVIRAVLALLACPGVGFVQARRCVGVLRATGLRFEDLAGQPESEVRRRAPAGAEDFAPLLSACSGCLLEQAEHQLRRAEDLGIHVVTVWDAAYPRPLLETVGAQAPPLLFVQGNAELLDRYGAGIVGTRHPSPAGRDATGAAAAFFAQQGVPVVSGGARGVDTEALRRAVQQGGPVVVVVPEGLGRYRRPPWLSDKVLEDSAIVSAWPPDTPWSRHAALMRNAYISAWSRVVCAVDAAERGGTMVTARHAVRQGRALFAQTPCLAARRLLEQLGANALCDNNGRVRTEALLDTVGTDTPPAAVQDDLFP